MPDDARLDIEPTEIIDGRRRERDEALDTANAATYVRLATVGAREAAIETALRDLLDYQGNAVPASTGGAWGDAVRSARAALALPRGAAPARIDAAWSIDDAKAAALNAFAQIAALMVTGDGVQ